MCVSTQQAVGERDPVCEVLGVLVRVLAHLLDGTITFVSVRRVHRQSRMDVVCRSVRGQTFHDTERVGKSSELSVFPCDEFQVNLSLTEIVIWVRNNPPHILIKTRGMCSPVE